MADAKPRLQKCKSPDAQRLSIHSRIKTLGDKKKATILRLRAKLKELEATEKNIESERQQVEKFDTDLAAAVHELTLIQGGAAVPPALWSPQLQMAQPSPSQKACK